MADRYFSGWFDLAMLWQRGVHSVVRDINCGAPTFAQASGWAPMIIWCAGINRHAPVGCPANNTKRYPLP